MTNEIGNYARHARYWDWSGRDRTAEHEYWLKYAAKYGKNVLIPMCAWGETGAYMAERGFTVTAFDITPEMIAEGKKRFGGVGGLRLCEGDVRDFHFDMPPADFCFSMDFGHILTIEDVKKALACINGHLRDGGCLVIETGLRLPGAGSNRHPPETFYPAAQVYPGIKVWKTGETRNDAETGRCHISQTFYAEDRDGNTESFDHAFYLQSYYREEWLAAFRDCGFHVTGEYGSREVESWQSGGGGFRIFEAVKTKTVFTPAQIEFAASMINRIDSGEKNLFLSSVNTEAQAEAKIFYGEKMTGVLYGCMIYKSLRIRISFENDPGQFNGELASLIRSAMNKANTTSCDIWVRNENRKIIGFLKAEFHTVPQGAHDYASVEFIMRRENFRRAAEGPALDVRPYEEEHIDAYLNLLDGSMTFIDPPHRFADKKEHYLQHFAERRQKDSFEAFWIDGTLVGLYWRKNAEIDFFAVDVNHQRKGYGTAMLTRALTMIFEKTAEEYAYLYAVDWNSEGQSFYRKYGMEQNGHSYHLKISNCAEGQD